MRQGIGYLMIMILTALTGCLDPYEPPVSKESADFLVIDGYINATSQTATVLLSRGVPLNSTKTSEPITIASVSIQDSNGSITSIPLVDDGRYELTSFFPAGQSYKLLVRIPGGKSYASEWISLQQNFPVENLRWEADEEALKFLVGTRAAGTGPFYFRYGYEETYEYRSVFQSDWKIESSVPVYRTLEENISTCWLKNSSSTALLASTEGLTQNLIADFNVLRIPKGDRRLWFGYSLLVKQYALDQKAYNYWESLRKVSESLGGLFDPIPFSVTGNIFPDENKDGEPDLQSTDGDRVLGYFSGGVVSSRRINIRNFELPSGYYDTQNTNCTEAYSEILKLPTIVDRQINLTRAQYEGLTIVGFYYAIPACTDCRLEGGSSLKPDYMN